MPNMKEAIDRAIEQTPGAIGLVDGVVKHSSWWAILYGQNAYIVEGTPLFSADSDNKNDAFAQQASYNNGHNNSVATPPYAEPTETMIFFHNVKDGETLAGIAKLYGVTVGDVIKWNKLSDNSISKGDKLTIRIKD